MRAGSKDDLRPRAVDAVAKVSLVSEPKSVRWLSASRLGLPECI